MLYLDSILGLTQGNPISPAALFSYLRMEYTTHTGIVRDKKARYPLIGQVHFNNGEQASRLSFLAPVENTEEESLALLLEHLAYQSGERGVFRVLAEMNESDPRIDCLRHNGFSVYTRQQIWKMAIPHRENEQEKKWVPYQNSIQRALQGLYHAVVPPLVQGAEVLDKRPVQGFCYFHKDELLAFIETIYGPKGIYLLPTVHPNFRDPDRLLGKLLAQLPTLLGRPVYFAVRDYQSWLNNTMEALGGQSSERKVLLVKHLAHQQRVTVPTGIRKVLEQHTTEPTAPFMNHSQFDQNNGEKL